MHFFKSFPAFLILLLFSCNTLKPASSPINARSYVQEKTKVAKYGMVVSAHALASQVGKNILQAGGNAFDAAIATQLALAVVYPGAGNIGGGGFLVGYKQNGETIALDYRETAPALAHKDMYLDAQGNAVSNKSTDGHYSCGVPGTVAGLFATLPLAKLPFSALIQPAILLAEKGFAITEAEANSLNALQAAFKKNNTLPTSFEKTGQWVKGDILIQEDLAATLKRIKKQGQKGFYAGKTARLIIQEMQRGGGIINYKDLKNYSTKIRAIHSFNYKGYTILSMPLPSSGGILLQQMLKMIENQDIEKMQFQTKESVQLMVEVERRAYADRAKHLGDADFVNVPVNAIVQDAYLTQRMQNYSPNKKNTSEEIKAGSIPGYESEETTHISIADKYGNIVAITTTLNNSYGSKTVVGKAGFLLNDEMDDFSIKPGVPNMYGAVGSKANEIKAGKRMLSSMTPTIVLKNNKPFLVVGTPGGTTIPTSVFQTLVNIIDFKMSSFDAVNKPKFHHQWLPDRIDVENEFSQTTLTQLKEMGYEIYYRNPIGRMEIIRILANGELEGVADKRGDDSADGY